MLHRERTLPPEYIYPVDEWKITKKQFDLDFLSQDETIFSTANGYLGMRGTYEEGDPCAHNGTFINAFHETWPIIYGEGAYGFAKTGQTMLNVTDTKIIKLFVDDEPFYLPTATLLRFERTLDMQAGTLDRDVLWEMPSGKQVLITSRRFVSFEHRHIAAMSYEVTVLNAKAPVVITSEMQYDYRYQVNVQDPAEDPREGHGFTQRPLLPETHDTNDCRVVLSHATQNSKMTLACGIEHRIATACNHSYTNSCTDDAGKVVFRVEAQPGEPIHLTKYMTYHTSRRASAKELCERADRALDHAVSQGFQELLTSQRQHMNDFWQHSDIQVRGDPRGQQCLRWNLFQLCQATSRAEGVGVGARGLTGQTYEGHYFWDTEIYILPFLIYTAPRIAKNLLKFRYTMLEKARKRAREVEQIGALFPWRTINGDEASAYYAAGTAQYHINADIMYALRKYVEVTGDVTFLYTEGAEMLVETARLWVDLGFFSEREEGKFCIHAVTGPDEYATVVNNNTFTNLMAQENLCYAAETLETLREKEPERFAVLVDKTGLEPAEVAEWQRAADNMCIPFDKKLGIHPQDDSFLQREVWDFANTPEDHYPLLLYYHPLVIHRHQVIKQADVVLAMFLLGDKFSLEQKQRNFDYYDPITTGDSSLSVSIQGIIACEIGYLEKAREYTRYAALMDLADIGGNVRNGAHISSIGGTWMAVVYGFAGMRDYNGQLSFRPQMPEGLEGVRFPLTIRGQELEVHIEKDQVTYLLRQGSELVITHWGEDIILSVGEPCLVSLKPRAEER